MRHEMLDPVALQDRELFVVEITRRPGEVVEAAVAGTHRVLLDLSIPLDPEVRDSERDPAPFAVEGVGEVAHRLFALAHADRIDPGMFDDLGEEGGIGNAPNGGDADADLDHARDREMTQMLPGNYAESDRLGSIPIELGERPVEAPLTDEDRRFMSPFAERGGDVRDSQRNREAED